MRQADRDKVASGNWFVDLGSTWRGIKAMRRDRGPAKWRWVWLPPPARSAWLHLWTPAWHNGRGPYLSAGFYIGAVFRGY